ncbi:MAG: hypothetical protein E7292_06260 [Lachnospiraceae bacterium]|nr:hypothetical protein [Lachnospiraceae bacterium]
MGTTTEKVTRKINGDEIKRKTWWEPILVVFLFWYPLRHIHWGIDWWDTGYNYANFEYAGLEHMDPMWFFSTYLANVVGHILTMLPGGDTLLGMNLYTGLFVSVLALLGYFFCTRKLQIPRGIAFVGEFVAISLCWCPTALLYNYLTYVLYLVCVILLYLGLTKDKMWLLFAAGVCLGTNVLVRFSNLPEAAMIVAVWAYAFWVWLESRKRTDKVGTLKDVEECVTESNQLIRAGGFSMAVRYTLWCLGGYLAALLVLLGYIFIKYGADTYINSIMRLFAMTENATDYKATSMLDGLISAYVENLYWVIRMGVFVAAGMAGFVALKPVLRLLVKLIYKKSLNKDDAWLKGQNLSSGDVPVVVRTLWTVAYICACLIAVLMVAWLYMRGFVALEFYTYGAMLWPGVTFLMLTMGIALLRIFQPEVSIDEKLISGMMILVILLTSLGSNNKVYPSMNNLFVAAPYTLWQGYQFVRNVKEWRGINFFPAKAALVAFMGLFLFQIGGFGLGFVFGEATGLQNITDVIDNNKVLAGVKMSPERAKIMTGITDFAKENNLIGKEVITYGKIPSVCYYLEMPPAFNSWSDLDSYQYGFMEDAMQELTEEIEAGEAECPVVILNNADLTYEESEKYGLIQRFLEKFNYDLSYENEKFKVYLTE